MHLKSCLRSPASRSVVSIRPWGGLLFSRAVGISTPGSISWWKPRYSSIFAAANIDEYLGFHHEIDPGVEIPTARLNNKPPHGRIDTTEREAGERKHDFKCIECGLTDEEAYSEASRCLRCDHFGYGIFRGGRKGKW